MLFYALIFFIVGLAIGKFIKEKNLSIGVILGTSFLWGLSHGMIWGFVTLGEIFLGYLVIEFITKNEASDSNKKDSFNE